MNFDEIYQKVLENIERNGYEADMSQQDMGKLLEEVFYKYFRDTEDKSIRLLKNLPMVYDFGDSKYAPANHFHESLNSHLYQYSNLNINYLVEIIKRLYEIHTGERYDSITFGYAFHQDYSDEARFYGKFLILIGKASDISKYKDLDNTFSEDPLTEFIVTEINGGESPWVNGKYVNISTNKLAFREDVYREIYGSESSIKFYYRHCLGRHRLSEWERNFCVKCPPTLYPTLPHDVWFGNKQWQPFLPFVYPLSDTFIPEFLYSLAYYRKNNDTQKFSNYGELEHLKDWSNIKKSLSPEVLNQLFYELYNEKLNLTEEMGKTKQLKVVRDTKYFKPRKEYC